MSDLVYRIQDRDGRGPFKPGFSKQWLDATPHCAFPSWLEEFGWCIPGDLEAEGWHFGSACRSVDGIKRWFSRTERRRLQRFGYSLMCLSADRILAESDKQLVVARRLPFAAAAFVVADILAPCVERAMTPQ